MNSKFVKFTQGYNTGNSLLVFVFLVAVISKNSGKRNDIADEMRRTYFNHKEMIEYKNCFPKTGCIDAGLCYTETICNLGVLNECMCPTERNCTLDDWAQVEPANCAIHEMGSVIFYTISLFVIFPLYLLGVVVIHYILRLYYERNITYCRYFIMIWGLQIYNVCLSVMFANDIGNYDGFYLKGMYLMWIAIFIQIITMIWPYIMDKTMSSNTSIYRRGTLNIGANLNDPQNVVPMNTLQTNQGETVGEAVEEAVEEEQGEEEAVGEEQGEEEGVGEAVGEDETNHTIQPNIIPIIRENRNRQIHLINQFERVIEDEISEQGQTITDTINHLCLICCVNKRNILLFPCRHLCYCEECGTSASNVINSCPYCREPVSNAIKIFVP